MDAFDLIATKLDIKEYDSTKKVPGEVKLKVLEAARLTGSGVNSQHWRFILVQYRDSMKRLAQDSTTGKWVESCDFAVIVLTDPTLRYHMVDAGRVAQDMEIAAWNYGVGSRVFTGVNAESLRRDFGFPKELNPTIIVGFGYPLRKITGRRKNRKSLQDVAFLEKYGERLDTSKIN